MTRDIRNRLALWVALGLIALMGACLTPRPPAVELPLWEPLPSVRWEVGPDGKACTSDTDALVKREKLRDLREKTYLEMLRALGAQEPAPSTR
jgi:hypothetical protein